MKRLIYIFITVLLSLPAVAQEKGKFDPAKFETEMENYIVSNGELTQNESAAFLPLWREMRKKQLEVMHSGKKFRHVDLNDEKKCAETIRHHDDNDIKLKEIQRTYHNKFLKVLPAGKVIRIIRAEDRFHRQAFKRVVDKQKRR